MKDEAGNVNINWKFFVVSVVVVGAVYVLLYIGSTKIAPVLIVLGYILTCLSLTPFKKGERNDDPRKKANKEEKN